MKIAPVVLFVFSRPDHTRRTLEALAANDLAARSELFIYADGARRGDEAERVKAVRALAHSAAGFRSCTVIERTRNYGLARNIIDGVTEICNRYGRVIVLEDDMVTSRYFLRYMNEALNLFDDNDIVASIHGWRFPTKQNMQEAFFLPGADCWGWATWSRSWAYLVLDGQCLFDELTRRGLLHSFDCNGAFPYSKMLKDQIQGKNESWAVRWRASMFLANKLTLHPGRSLVHNIGNDASGTHSKNTSIYDTQLSSTPIDLSNIEISPSITDQQALEDYFIKTRGNAIRRILYKIPLITKWHRK